MKTKYPLLPLLLACIMTVGAFSCSDKLIDDAPVEAGSKAIVHLSVSTPEMQLNTRASLTEDEEKNIKSILVYIFGKDKKIISFTMHESTAAHTTDNKNLDPNGGNSMEIETLTGNDYTIYVVANYYDNSLEGFRDITTESDLNKLIVEVYGNILFREYGMLKVGKLTNQSIRDNTLLKVPLKYVSAKVTVNVINKATDFRIDGWKVSSLPKKTYLLERPNNTADPNYHDASDINNPYDYNNDFAEVSFPFEGGDGTTAKPYTTTFYLLENRRGGRVTRPEPPGGLAQYNGKEYLLKTWYAPKNATFLSVTGFKSDENKAITINYHLGKTNHDNYDVERGVHYIVNFTVNGLDKIVINTNIDTYDVDLPIRQPEGLMNIDAHPSARLFQLYTNLITNIKTKVDIEVLQDVNSSQAPQWLNIAVFPTFWFHVRSSDPIISLWQQEGDVGTYVRPKFIPSKATRNALQLKGTPYSPPAGVLLGSADYPDDDKELPFSKAIHRLCKRITNLPTYASTNEAGGTLNGPIGIFLYTDEYTSDLSELYREAVVRVTVDNGNGEPQYSFFRVRQYSPIKYMDLPSRKDNKTLYVERHAEFNALIQTTLPIDKQYLGGMQWGPYDNGADDPVNGYGNTLLGVYKTSPIANTDYRAANMLPKYGSRTGGWNTSDMGKIYEGAGIPTEGAPYFSLSSIQANGYNSILNSSAARYCHEKNWDVNGDGEIDASETNWYLPARHELQLMWTLHQMLDLMPEYYWSSTEADTDNAYAFAMRDLQNDSKYNYDGLSQRLPKVTPIGTNPPRVRCVRRAGHGTGPLIPNVYTSVDGSVVMDCITLPGSVYTSVSKNNIPQNAPLQVHAANQKIYRRFEVSKVNGAPVNYFDLHNGNGKCDAVNGWRLPTQTEMLLIWATKEKLKTTAGSSFADFASGTYWTMTRTLDRLYVVDFVTGLADIGSYFGANDKFYYRCIREIP